MPKHNIIAGRELRDRCNPTKGPPKESTPLFGGSQSLLGNGSKPSRDD